ncbi:MAG: glycerol kinase GlpK [Deltaproteobacteria bacterium]|nr:glycerol kinase GlpK [Deltaproteobacteria bacterium]
MAGVAKYILALDQGTTSSRSILYDLSGCELAVANKPISVNFPSDGWVEQEACEIWEAQLATMREVCSGVEPASIAAIGIANQRETLICWDPLDGKVLAPAIVWQCRRSSEICSRLRRAGLQDEIGSISGLVLDPYFSASKILWLQENVDGLRERMQLGRAVFGTVDSWLVYNLTKSKTSAPALVTESSNASRTMLFSLKKTDWDDKLLEIFSLYRHNLPRIVASFGIFGRTSILGGGSEIPICGVLGDQQASLLGHGCIASGSGKCTFGTGAFMLVNTGREIVTSNEGLLSSVAWQMRGEVGRAAVEKGDCSYVVEGSVFMAGALIGWLRDGIGLISSSAESELKASQVNDSSGVVVVPAFVGLGAPYWDDSARGIIVGLNRNVTANHIVRACLEGVAHQVADLLECSGLSELRELNIDGGMSANEVFCQILADISQREVVVSSSAELTALGAARAAAFGAGEFNSLEHAVESMLASGSGSAKPLRRFAARKAESQVAVARRRWKSAVERSRDWS